MEFLTIKDWENYKVPGTDLTLKDLKAIDFNWAAPLDMTNISVNYGDAWLEKYNTTGDVGDVFRKNVAQALRTAEPGFSFNFGSKANETLRNACTEVTSEDDSDVCNLGSLNMGRIESLEEMREITELGIKFLLCGTLRAKLPYEKVEQVRAKNRRLGLGLMGVHEWLIKKGYKYEVTPELHEWLAAYRDVSDSVGDSFADELGISRPKAKRAIAPTGTIGILAGTTTGIEPLYAVAYKRRFLTNGTEWNYEYVVDGAAKELIEIYGANPDNIESSIDLAEDMAISSTINLPEWGSRHNNPDKVVSFTETLAKYAHRLRGFTCYPDGSRGGQPLTSVPYSEAIKNLGQTFSEKTVFHDICDISGKGGTCGG
jgi:ribonucleoside-diphosphate reductase alpha chain